MRSSSGSALPARVLDADSDFEHLGVVRTYGPGSELLQQGTPADEIHLIRDGKEECFMFENKQRSFKWMNGILCVLTLSLTIHAAMQTAPSDPGVRGGAPGAGGPISGLTVQEGKFFQAGQDAFSETQSVLGTQPGTEAGLGPRFNMDSCVGCHAHPSSGGSSPAVNPQVGVANKLKLTPTNLIPYFVTINGPVREAL